MATVSTNELKNGMTLDLGGELMRVVEFQHVKPGKGHAFVRTTLKNARSGAVLDKTFRAGEKVERVMIDKREQQYLYRDGSGFVFMDNQTFDQHTVPEGAVGAAGEYLVEGTVALLQVHGSEIIGVDLPAAVELQVIETEPGFAGDRVSGARKPATLVTGKVVQVPLFVEVGEIVKVDTRSGEYLSRA